MGILIFGFVTLGGQLLLLLLPTLFLIFARRVRPLAKCVWVAISLIPLGVAYAMRNHAYPTAYAIFPEWALCFLFLWFGRDPPAVQPRLWRRVGLISSTVIYVGLLIRAVLLIHANVVEQTSEHILTWPLNASGSHFVRLRVPPHYNGGIEAMNYPNGVKPAGVPDQVEILARVLWPSLATRDFSNEAEFEAHPTKFLDIQFKALNRVDFQGRVVNKLLCGFEGHLNMPTGDCFNPTPVLQSRHPFVDLAPRYGLERKGEATPPPSDKPLHYRLSDIWFARAADGTVATFIECPNEFKLNDYALCTHTFEVPSLNAMIQVTYNNRMLPQWKTIEATLTNTLQAMVVR